MKIIRGGATIAHKCLDGPVLGTRDLPKVAKGDIVQVRAISKVTFAVVTVAAGGARYSLGTGGAIDCP